MGVVVEQSLAERVKSLSPDKVDLLMKRLAVKKGGQPASHDAATRSRPFDEGRDHNFQLVTTDPGSLNNLRFVPARRLPIIDPDELEVEVEAACLNFRDVALALGLYPRALDGTMPKLGCDGAGRISRVGPAVSEFKVGDEVFFVTGDGTFSRYARVPEMRVYKKPADWSFAEASGLALTFTTVFESLMALGRMRAGERILIHCAAGGVGLAAIQLAKKLGVEIFATSGTEEKRAYVRSLGIAHVMDSRSLLFADEVMALTNGEGVDLVLNSLPGEAIEAGLRVLRKGGRFIELGKRDLVAGRTLDMAPFSKALTFAALDIGAGVVATLNPTVKEVRRALAAGELRPLPTQVYPLSELGIAFHHMTLGNHIGRIAIQMKGQPVLLTPGVAS